MSATNESSPRNDSEDVRPPAYDEIVGSPPRPCDLPTQPRRNRRGLTTDAPPDSPPPPYHAVVGEVPPRPDNFRMDMTEFPANMHPPVEAYYDDGWKCTIVVFVVSLLGIILMTVLVSVILVLNKSNNKGT
ncbi:Rh68 [macacine betaherpesvirus 3]|nr:Rh68 [macacine betaherpesvirus 3]